MTRNVLTNTRCHLNNTHPVIWKSTHSSEYYKHLSIRVETSTWTRVDFKRVPGILLLPGYFVYLTLINKNKRKPLILTLSFLSWNTPHNFPTETFQLYSMFAKQALLYIVMTVTTMDVRYAAK